MKKEMEKNKKEKEKEKEDGLYSKSSQHMFELWITIKS